MIVNVGTPNPSSGTEIPDAGFAEDRRASRTWGDSSPFRCALVGFSARMREISSGSAVAETSYRAAIAIAQQQSAKFWGLRIAMSLARLWRDQDKRVQARDLLAPVYGWFSEGFGTPVLQDAKALLNDLADAPAF